MAAKNKAAKAQRAAMKARYNPYVQQLIDDEDLRENLVDAYEAPRGAYGRVSTASRRRSRSSTTRSSRSELKEASATLRDAPSRCTRRRRRSVRGGFGRILLVGIVGAGLALALTEGLRKKVLDALFGAEEEFEYTSTTSSPRRRTRVRNSGATSSTAGPPRG